jgi:phosphatidylserine/phosphatidylglycerophosphate/cardiolipin synthase-like enzyme
MMVAAMDRIAITPAERRAAVIDLIAAARSRLILSLFRCDDFSVLDALVAALARGVTLEVLTTDRAKGGRKRLDQIFTVLANSGATMHRYGDSVVKYHAKYMAADTRLALIGSANWTHKCLDKTCDFMLTTGDRGVVRALDQLFAADCAGRPLGSDAANDRLVIGPESARVRLAALLCSARRSIDIIDPQLTDPDMRGLLLERRDAGVRVTCRGRHDVGGLSAHGKLIVVDGHTAVIGSLSLSALQLGFRRELAISTTDRRVVRSLSGFLAGLDLARARRVGSTRRTPLKGAL